MKNVKLIFALLLVTSLILSCKKNANNYTLEKITALELKIKYGIEIPGIDYNESSVARGKKKASTVIVSVIQDLIISGSVTCTVSPNAEWGGIQKFLALPLSNDGAISYCNFNWSNTAAPSVMDCPTTISGIYRGWTSDKITYDVHLSNTITIP